MHNRKGNVHPPICFISKAAKRGWIEADTGSLRKYNFLKIGSSDQSCMAGIRASFNSNMTIVATEFYPQHMARKGSEHMYTAYCYEGKDNLVPNAGKTSFLLQSFEC
jgi:hypothetical protein